MLGQAAAAGNRRQIPRSRESKGGGESQPPFAVRPSAACIEFEVAAEATHAAVPAADEG